MIFTFRPIQRWPRAFTKDRPASRFGSTYAQTINLLCSELEHLGARGVAIQTAMTPEMIRNDGLPRASAKPSHPGVIVSFETSNGSMSFPCDRFPDWESNLRAIALSLEALRKVDRYGVTSSREQYRGWQALPPPAQAAEKPLTILEAAAFVFRSAGVDASTGRTMLQDRALMEKTYRQAAARLHPDKGGSHEAFVRLQTAKAVLDKQVSDTKGGERDTETPV